MTPLWLYGLVAFDACLLCSFAGVAGLALAGCNDTCLWLVPGLAFAAAGWLVGRRFRYPPPPSRSWAVLALCPATLPAALVVILVGASVWDSPAAALQVAAFAAVCFGPAFGLTWLGLHCRHKPGHCDRCGYDLTGNVSGRCPECGRPVREQAAHRAGQAVR